MQTRTRSVAINCKQGRGGAAVQLYILGHVIKNTQQCSQMGQASRTFYFDILPSDILFRQSRRMDFLLEVSSSTLLFCSLRFSFLKRVISSSISVKSSIETSNGFFYSTLSEDSTTIFCNSTTYRFLHPNRYPPF